MTQSDMKEDKTGKVSILIDGELVKVNETLPLIPLRDVVVFPRMIIPLLVGRARSIKACEVANTTEKLLFLVAQRSHENPSPTPAEIHTVGTVSRITHFLRLPDGTVRILIEGLFRARIAEWLDGEYFSVSFAPIQRKSSKAVETRVLLRSVTSHFEQYVKLNRKIPDEVLMSVIHIEDPERLADTISAHIQEKLQTKQRILESRSLQAQLRLLLTLLTSEIEILELEQKLEEDVKSEVLKNQKQFYLAEQLKVIKKELGHAEGMGDEIEELTRAIELSRMPQEAETKARRELERLRKMAPLSPEATVIRNYVDWLVSLPWKKRTRDNLNIPHAKRILDEDHYGLKKPKERILEFLAVLKLVKQMRGQILCFVGAPGVGKTSLAKSIARTLGRKFVRMSLGGIRDEAEIRGHRRTYIGALPGRIIQNMKRAGTKNPVFLLDEVDKIGVDYRGDPAAALMEVLDPELNYSFNDHYLETDFDLSEVFFICTANVLHTIPPALRDRMETIRLPGYLEYEKLKIAEGFLIPKQLRAHGLKSAHLRFTHRSIQKIIRNYTKEAGVRSLEREIGSIARKVARAVAEGKKQMVTVKSPTRYLGAPKFVEKELSGIDEVGVATGLTWTEAGGEIIQVEAGIMRGKGELILTGQLGEVMKESAQAALTFARANTRKFKVAPGFYRSVDIHVHVPEGAIPKDGPSAGITIATALVSTITGIPVKRDVAMTGEVTLRGEILPIGGLAEKMVAAQRAGIGTVIIPEKNGRELKELPAFTKRGLDVRLVKSMHQVLEIALKSQPARVSRVGRAQHKTSVRQ
jgi:ATP-dependent Lon protease